MMFSRSNSVLILMASAPMALAINPARLNAQTLPVPSGVALWMDAADSTTIFDGAGVNPGGGGFNAATIKEWRDKSSNALHMTSVTDMMDFSGANFTDPSYLGGGMPAVSFTDKASLGNLTPTGLPTTEARTLFFVGRQNNNSNDGTVVHDEHEKWYFNYGGSGGNPGDIMAFRTDDASGGVGDPTPTPVQGNNIFRNNVTVGGIDSLKGGDLYDVTSPPGANIIIEWSWDGTDTYTQYHNGILDHSIVAAGQLNTPLDFAAHVGNGRISRQRSDWDMNELILYNRTLTGTERKDVGDYLSQKWGISIAAIPSDRSWNVDASGDWNVDGNWTFGGAPNNRNQTATFGPVIGQRRTVFTDSDFTINRVTFDSSATYAVAGTGSVSLQSSTGGTSAGITVSQGTHQFQALVNLTDSATVDVDSGATLIFNNALDLGGNTLTKTGMGEMAIRNDLLTGGGTVIIQQGMVSGNGTVGGDVSNGGGTISPGNSVGLGLAVVPEPSAVLLLWLGTMSAVACWRSTGTQRK